MKMPRFRTTIAIAVAALIVGLCGFGSERGGLFNNRADPVKAIEEHYSGWRQRGLRRDVGRLFIEGLVRNHDGSCITREAEWERVDMGQRLDPYLLPERKRIDCRFPISRQRLLWIPVQYMWIIELEPISRNEVRVLRMSRMRDPLSF